MTYDLYLTALGLWRRITVDNDAIGIVHSKSIAKAPFILVITDRDPTRTHVERGRPLTRTRARLYHVQMGT